LLAIAPEWPIAAHRRIAMLAGCAAMVDICEGPPRRIPGLHNSVGFWAATILEPRRYPGFRSAAGRMALVVLHFTFHVWFSFVVRSAVI
jgi:hypothetical protein